ncbi:MAG: hypothetical protein IKF66_01265 [Methanobrevibacter sp.]|nr:hypothetical protein [Methanobrevibacter sp.]
MFNLDDISEALKKIRFSNLLSCKNCPENKGGYICQKEYNDKCLTQKIQFIKELQEEIAGLKTELEISRRCWQDQKNISLDTNCKLYKAKEILREYIRINLLPPNERNFDEEVKLFKQAEKFCEEIN